jgi:hypothetical protein
MQIDISFQHWQALTALLRNENDTYDAVIQRLIERMSNNQSQGLKESEQLGPAIDAGSGAYFKDVFMPNGTEMRATYKGETYFAKISGSKWVDCETGETRTSPSQAAYSITGRNVNGWLFWIVKRPNDEGWRSLNALRVVRS